MKVLHVLNTGEYSGAENVVITLIRLTRGVVESAYTSPEGSIASVLSENNILYFPMRTSNASIRELRKIIKEFKPDIIHAHDFLASVIVSLASRKIPIVSHLHNNPFWIKKICIWTVIYICSSLKYKRVLVVSDSIIEEFVFGKYLKKKSKTVGNPIDLREIREKAKNATEREQFDIVFLGRLTKAKNPIFFLDIVKELVGLFPDLRVAVVGDGELHDVVMETCIEFGVNNNVKLFGFVKNPYGILKSSKLLCMPSQWEGFGLAAVEALAFGLPVVAAPVGGLVNIVTSQCGKLCVSKKDYVEEIEKLLSDREYYKSKSQNAKARSEKFDNANEYAKSILDEYKSFW